MIYVHSYSPIEKAIANLLSLKEEIAQVDIYDIDIEGKINNAVKHTNSHVLFYSYQKMEDYHHLTSFRKEYDAVKKMIEYCKKTNIDKIIFLTYPGSYCNSDNLFLQHKGLIEQAMVDSKLNIVALKVQGIYNAYTNNNNFHDLFFDQYQSAYIIPRNIKSVIYAVSIYNLVEAIKKAAVYNASNNFDIFDQVSTMYEFLYKYSNQIQVLKLASIYLYFKSFIGKYNSPAMIELFLRPIVPMYNFRTEKELGIKLEQDEPPLMYNPNTKQVMNLPSIFSLR